MRSRAGEEAGPGCLRAEFKGLGERGSGASAEPPGPPEATRPKAVKIRLPRLLSELPPPYLPFLPGVSRASGSRDGS